MLQPVQKCIQANIKEIIKGLNQMLRFGNPLIPTDVRAQRVNNGESASMLWRHDAIAKKHQQVNQWYSHDKAYLLYKTWAPTMLYWFHKVWLPRTNVNDLRDFSVKIA